MTMPHRGICSPCGGGAGACAVQPPRVAIAPLRTQRRISHQGRKELKGVLVLDNIFVLVIFVTFVARTSSCLLWLLYAGEPAIAREDDRLRARPDTELVEEIGDVITDGLVADREARGDFRVAEPLADERQD